MTVQEQIEQMCNRWVQLLDAESEHPSGLGALKGLILKKQGITALSSTKISHGDGEEQSNSLSREKSCTSANPTTHPTSRLFFVTHLIIFVRPSYSSHAIRLVSFISILSLYSVFTSLVLCQNSLFSSLTFPISTWI